jgi:hypothetical protein
VAAGAAAGAVAGCSSELSFFPQLTIKSAPSKSAKLPIASDLFLFMLFLPLP